MYIDNRMGKRAVMYLYKEMPSNKEKGLTTDMCNLDVSHRHSMSERS